MLPTTTRQKAQEIKDKDLCITDEELLRKNLRLSDVMRLGSKVTNKAEGWGNGENACALHAAVIGATAMGINLDH